jgi:hypothetical protein
VEEYAITFPLDILRSKEAEAQSVMRLASLKNLVKSSVFSTAFELRGADPPFFMRGKKYWKIFSIASLMD